jgi:hypothetical protein
MSSRDLQFELPPHAIHHGVIVEGSFVADYYTSQPAPSQWIAVGVVRPCDEQLSSHRLRRMLVGDGLTADDAMAALRTRIADLQGNAGSLAVLR